MSSPSFFYYINETDFLRISLNSTFEDRLGGDITAIEEGVNGIHGFTEENESTRLSYQITYENELDEARTLTIKHSLNYFDRTLLLPQNNFMGTQWSTFTELAYRKEKGGNSWVSGFNIYSDSFNENNANAVLGARDYDYTTLGAFTQNTTALSSVFSLESGLRFDYDFDHGFFALPRASLLAKINEKWSARIGGGLGYRLPTIFTEEAETIGFRGVSPLNIDAVEAETSIGGNLDFNFKTALGGDWTFSLNQLFFYTRLNDALVFQDAGNGRFVFENANGRVSSQGMETNLKLTYQDFKLFANYALIDTRLKFDNTERQKPLTPKHHLGLVLIYEQHGKWRVGFEAYYKGEQFRNDLSQTDDYWMAGFMAMRKWKQFGLYINFENFTDTRQHNLENFDISNHFSPNFPDIWAPTDGFIVNGGIILEF